MLIQASELWRFRLSTADGAVGRVHDLQVDDRRWTVTDVVVGLGHWLTDRSVILSPASVVKLDEPRRSLRVGLTADELARAPAWPLILRSQSSITCLLTSIWASR